MTKVESSSGGWTGKIARVDLVSREVIITSSLDISNCCKEFSVLADRRELFFVEYIDF